MKIFSALLIILLISVALECQPIEFFREDITFTIQDSFFCVDGVYHFCNVTEKPVTSILFYPFPVDSLYAGVDSVFIYNLTDSIPVDLRRKESGVSFQVSLEPFRVGKYKIFYTQKLYGNKAEYILKTTKYWEKPLQVANFQLEIPSHIKIDSLSYEPDSVYVNEGKSKYFWQMKNFMTDKNFIILFEVVN